jgi:hypothetical protein
MDRHGKEVVWALGGITLLPYILLPIYGGMVVSTILNEVNTGLESDPDSFDFED